MHEEKYQQLPVLAWGQLFVQGNSNLDFWRARYVDYFLN